MARTDRFLAHHGVLRLGDSQRGGDDMSVVQGNAPVMCERTTCCWENREKDEACRQMNACGCAVVKHMPHRQLFGKVVRYHDLEKQPRRTTRWKILHSAEEAEAEKGEKVSTTLIEAVRHAMSEMESALGRLSEDLRSASQVEDATKDELRIAMRQSADKVDRLRDFLK